MRYVYTVLIVLITALVVVFMFQNLQTATVALLSYSMTLPLSALILATYVLGMFTGGSVLALVRTAVRGATRGASR